MFCEGLQDDGDLRAGLFSLQACDKSGVFQPSLKALMPWASGASHGPLFEILIPVAVLWRRAVLMPPVRDAISNYSMCLLWPCCLGSKLCGKVTSRMMGMCACCQFFSCVARSRSFH